MKFLIGILTAILISGIAGAQHGNTSTGLVSLGIKGGVNIYNVYNDNGTEYDSRLGYHFGLLGHIHLGGNFAFQPEIVYSAQGSKYKVNNETTENNLDYINIPLLLQYMYNDRFRLQAGPQIGFLINAKSKNNDSNTDIKDDLNPIDFCLSIGASYIIPSTGFGIDGRYNFGISNINKNGDVNSTNRGFQLGIFYIFGH